MIRRPRLALFALALFAPTMARAQDRIVYDTLGPDTPTGVTCGFCAGERFGVVFRELPAPRRGLEPGDYPITLEAVHIAIAAASPTASACTPSEAGGTIVAPIEIYAGRTVPTGSIVALPADGAWAADEELVWAADAPLTLSVAESGGGGRYTLNFNVLEIRDEEGAPIRIDSGAYIRVVATLPTGTPGSSAPCEAASFESPGGFPVRDGDGTIAPERNFIYAAGTGWIWNEQVPLNGDWGVRLVLFRTVTPRDAGAPALDAGSRDAGAARDASAPIDAGRTADAGAGPGGGGCSCRAAGGRGLPLAWAVAIATLLLPLLRRRRAR